MARARAGARAPRAHVRNVPSSIPPNSTVRVLTMEPMKNIEFQLGELSLSESESE